MTGRIDGPAERGRRPRLLPRRRPAGGGARAAAACGSTPATAAAAGREIAADADYGDRSYGVAFAADGRLATTSYDGRLRLYDADGALLRSVATPHARPYRPRLQPDGRPAGGRLRRLDRGGCSTTARRSRRCRRRTSAASTTATSRSVAWSADGATLFAAGQLRRRQRLPGDRLGRRRRRAAPGAAGRRQHGDEPAAAAGRRRCWSPRSDPWLGVLAADGTPRWTRGAAADRPARPAEQPRASRPTACWSSSASSYGARTGCASTWRR